MSEPLSEADIRLLQTQVENYRATCRQQEITIRQLKKDHALDRWTGTMFAVQLHKLHFPFNMTWDISTFENNPDLIDAFHDLGHRLNVPNPTRINLRLTPRGPMHFPLP